jgi:hypothetical protein
MIEVDEKGALNSPCCEMPSFVTTHFSQNLLGKAHRQKAPLSHHHISARA